MSLTYKDPVRTGPKPNVLWPSGITMDEIVSIMRQRRSQDALLIQGMIEIRDRYAGDVVVPLPDVSGREAAHRPGPNFIQEAIDGLARRANSMIPRIMCPPVDPDQRSECQRAERRRDALYGGWYASQLDIKLHRAYRHLVGYGTCALMVMPNDITGHAQIELRDPITSYPELRAPDDIRPPGNVGFLFARSADWIRTHYPEAEQYVLNAPGRSWDTLWDMVEWIDSETVVVGIMGPRMPAYSYQDSRPYGYTSYELRRWPNKAGMVPVVVPRRVTLDRILGQITSIIGYTDQYARLMALALIADEKAVFPDIAIISKTGMPPMLASGRWKDGRTGEVNLVTDAVVEVIGKNIGLSTAPMLEMTEEAIRGTAGAAGVMAGKAGAAGRSGAAVDALGGYQIDPMVQEAQGIMARSLATLNEGFMAVEEGYYGDKKFTVVLGLRGSMKSVTYVPARDFRYKENVVSYPLPGADMNQLAVFLAQGVTTQMISKRTARHLNPSVDDPEQEEELISMEEIEGALRDGFATQLAQGAMSPAVAARVITLVRDGKDFPHALLQATAEAASQGPAPGTPEAAAAAGAGAAAPGGQPSPAGPGGGPPGAGGPGGQPMAPELAQMLAAQGAGPQAQPGGQPGAPPGLMNLRHVLQGINENASSSAV